MFVLRQINAQLETGADATEPLTNDVRAIVSDVNPRYIMELAGDGKFSSDYTQIAATTSFVIPLPQNYTTTNMLHVMLTADQTVQIATAGANGASNVMIRAGANQPGILVQCGPVTSITVTTGSATTTTLEWFLFELPAITTNAGWRDGSLVTGLNAP